MAAVCDGMGGIDAGECASGYLTEELVTWFYDEFLEAVGKKKPLWVIRNRLERKIYQAQSRMQRYAKSHSLQMGTTLSLLLFWEKKYLLCHLGDSRIYRLFGKKCGINGKNSGKKGKNGKRGKNSGSRIRQMTKDHTQGGSALTKCVGSFGFFEPDFQIGSIKAGEAFLLCSDGIWHRMRIEELYDALAPAQMRSGQQGRRLREIGEAAMRRGEKDNLSAVYIQISRKKAGRRLS